MNVLCVALLLVAVPPPADRAKLLPVPAAAELAKAEADLREVFGGDLKAARKPADKVALAGKMIGTAEGSQPAERYALLTRARELAIAARDSATGIRAVEGLAGGFAGPSNAADGHRLWDAARDLAGKLTAAEVYLRALPALAGFERGVVERRLRGLGWGKLPAGAKVVYTFEQSTIDNQEHGRFVANLAGAGYRAVLWGPTIGTGKVGAGLHFGPQATAGVDGANSLDLSRGLSAACWVRPSRKLDGDILSQHDSTGGHKGFILQFSPSRRVKFLAGDGEELHPVASEPIRDDPRWVHVAFTFDGRHVKIYLDGALVARGDVPKMVPSRLGLRIGRAASRERASIAGDVDELVIYGRALSAAEVSTIYRMGRSSVSLTPEKRS